MSTSRTDLDATFLIGGVLQQLALGIYEFQLVFHTNAYLSVRGKLQLETTDKRKIDISADNPEQSKELYFLLGRTVIDAEISEAQVLKIVFDDQSRIMIPPTNSGYDSYIVHDKDRYITV